MSISQFFASVALYDFKSFRLYFNAIQTVSLGTIEVNPSIFNLFEVRQVYGVDAYQHKHQFEYVQIALVAFFYWIVEECPKVFNFQIALARCHISDFESTERVGCRNLIVNGVVEYRTNISEVDIPCIY